MDEMNTGLPPVNQWTFPPGTVVVGETRLLPDGQWELAFTLTPAEPDPEPIIVEGS